MNTDLTESKWMRFTRHLVRLEKTASVSLLVVVVAVLAAQVIARYVFRAPISWSEEVARLALIWLTFVASGFVTADREHIVVDLIPRRLGKPVREMLDRLAGGFVLITCLLLLIGGFRFVWRVWPVGSPGIGVSKSLWYAAASFGLALMSFHTTVQLFAGSDSGRAVPKSGAEGRSPEGPVSDMRGREVRP
jgi:TRAP-type C4-dicarboxylate transport system permease small subunit